jgi:hypothetical protein
MLKVTSRARPNKSRAPAGVAARFLRRRFGAAPDHLHVLLCTKRGDGKRSHWLSVSRLAEAESFLTPLCKAGADDVYVGAGLSPSAFGRNRRCDADKVAGIAGLWADVDVQGDAHKKKNLPETLDQARQLARSLGVEPTEEIASGHGLQAWWLFQEPWIFQDDNDRRQAADLARRFQEMLRAKAGESGWEIDSTYDLARVLRLPGTWNHKTGDPVRVRVLRKGGPRYDVADFLALVPPPAPPPLNGTAHDAASVTARARRYVANMPAAVSGQGGHNATWAVVQVLVRGFGLSPDEARPILEEFNGRCVPPWSKEELEHKLEQAEGKSRLPPGYLLNGAGRKAVATPDVGDGADEVNTTDNRPTILISTEEHRTNDEAIAALADDPDLYQRHGLLVRIVKDRSPAARGRRRPAAPRIEPLPQSLLSERLTTVAKWFSPGAKGPKPAHPPGWCVAAVHARGCWHGIRHLEAVLDHPVLKPDGTILQQPGYDGETGLLLVPEGTLPDVPENPSKDEAIAARDLLLGEVVADFPFQRKEHCAAWLASLLTPLARFAFNDKSPLFLVDSNVRGSGKGLLLHATSMIVTGAEFPTAAYTDNEEELRKRITSIAM